MVRARQFLDDRFGVGPDGGESCVRRRNEPIPAQRQPEEERGPRESLRGSAQASGVDLAHALPATGHVARNLDLEKWVDDSGERLIDAYRVHDEGVTEMEHGLLAKTELPNGGAVGGLDALSERKDPLPVVVSEHPVVRDQEPRPAEQGIAGVRPTGQCVESKATCSSIVSVLKKLFQNRVTGLVAVLQIALDLIDHRDRRHGEAGHDALFYAATIQGEQGATLGGSPSVRLTDMAR